jgi:hypothetical protein
MAMINGDAKTIAIPFQRAMVLALATVFESSRIPSS